MRESDPTPATMSPQERVAREFLAQGRFRKARDEFKLLCKVDRAKFLPLLVQANIGLAREMMGKGMVNEARQVVSYLKTIAPPEALLALELEMGAGPRDQRPASQDVLAVIAKTAPGSDERQRLADGVVLMFEPVPGSPPEVASLGLELEAVISALRAISERQFERALHLVRPFGQSSAFSHWKMFIKGLAAFHAGEKEKAARFFLGLPAASVPGKAAQAYLLLCGTAPLPKTIPSEAVLEAACRLGGEPGCGEALRRAEQEWRNGNAAQMYLSLRQGIRRFPSEGVDFLGVLSEFAVNSFHTLPDEARDGYINRVAIEFVDRGRAKSPLEEMLLLRTTMLDAMPVIPDSNALNYMERYLRIRTKLHSPDPAFDSMVYGWLGEIMSKPGSRHSSPFGSFLPPNSGMRNSLEARRLLEKAVSLDHNNLPASLNLCEVYRQTELTSERNLLLDSMASRFSDDKNVLLMVAQACVDRKSPKKALDYLYQALLVDRLDPAIPDLVVKTLLFQAREQFQKERPDLARRSLVDLARHELTNSENLHRSSWCLKIQRGVMESSSGDEVSGRALLDGARRESPSAAAFLYYAMLAALQLGQAGRKLAAAFSKEFSRLLKHEANVADAILLTRIWSFGQSLMPPEQLHESTNLLSNYLRAAAKRPFVREDARRLVEFGLAENYFEEAAAVFVKSRLREDARDPAFRLFDLQLAIGSPGTPVEDDRKELEGILAEAIVRKDDQSIRAARQKLDSIGLQPPLPAPMFNPEKIFGDDDDDDAEDEAFLASLTPEQREFMTELMDVFANGSDREIQMFKETRPPGMSDDAFDMLVDFARGNGPFGMPDFGPANPARPKPARKSRPPSKSDPNQPELFEP